MLNSLSHFFFNRFRHNEAKLHELNYLFWECTLRCNLNCLHCGSDCLCNSRYPDMPFDDFLNAILPLKEIYKRDSITVVITGGEPILRPDLPDCGRILRKHGFRWGIVTNGFAYNADLHARLMAAGMGSITLSLDGLEAKHNWLRQNNKSFHNAIQALDLIVGNPRLFYDVVTCVNPQNIDELDDLYELLVSKKVRGWRLFTIAPIGRAALNNDLLLNGKQLNNLMTKISDWRKLKQMDVKFSCEAYAGKYESKVRDSHFFCRAGIQIASVLIDGSISACPNINRKYVQGNIYNDSFSEIWDSRFDVMRNRDWTRHGKCGKCSDYKNCEGGAMHLWQPECQDISVCIHQKILAQS